MKHGVIFRLDQDYYMVEIIENGNKVDDKLYFMCKEGGMPVHALNETSFVIVAIEERNSVEISTVELARADILTLTQGTLEKNDKQMTIKELYHNSNDFVPMILETYRQVMKTEAEINKPNMQQFNDLPGFKDPGLN